MGALTISIIEGFMWCYVFDEFAMVRHKLFLSIFSSSSASTFNSFLLFPPRWISPRAQDFASFSRTMRSLSWTQCFISLCVSVCLCACVPVCISSLFLFILFIVVGAFAHFVSVFYVLFSSWNALKRSVCSDKMCNYNVANCDHPFIDILRSENL